MFRRVDSLTSHKSYLWRVTTISVTVYHVMNSIQMLRHTSWALSLSAGVTEAMKQTMVACPSKTRLVKVT